MLCFIGTGKKAAKRRIKKNSLIEPRKPIKLVIRKFFSQRHADVLVYERCSSFDPFSLPHHIIARASRALDKPMLALATECTRKYFH